jgi:iron-sulfur cluster repair protein YtfE (RIC family)
MSSNSDERRPSVVREQVLIQHQALRHELERVLELAGEGSHPLLSPVQRQQELAEALRALRHHLKGHLAFEERWLAPLLAEADVWGPQRVSELLVEHEGQRRRLDDFVAGLDGGWDMPRLSREAKQLASELLADMTEEEGGCLCAELLRDDVVAVDQATD